MIRQSATTWIARSVALAFALAGCDGPPPQPVPAATTPTSAPTPIPLAVNLSLESVPDAPPAGDSVRVYFKNKFNPIPGLPAQLDLAEELPAGKNTIDLVDLPDGDRTIYFHADGYADQWIGVTIANGKATAKTPAVTLYRKRYVTLLYAFNRDRASADLSAAAAKPRRIVLEHWGGIAPFNQDWQIWQGNPHGGKMFGPEPLLSFHRIISGYGFAQPAEGQTFDNIVAAPTDPAAYECKSVAATPGLTLICRVNGNLRTGQLAYGKVMVEAVSLTMPTIKQPE